MAETHISQEMKTTTTTSSSSFSSSSSTNNDHNNRTNDNTKNTMCMPGVSTTTSAPLEPTTSGGKQLPSLAHAWLNLYQSSPKIYVGGSSGKNNLKTRDASSNRLDVGFMVLSMVFFLVIKTIIHYVILERLMGWPADNTLPDDPRLTWDAAACFTGCVHSINLVAAIGTLLWSSNHIARPSGAIGDHPQWWQDLNSAVMQFCTGYMLYDAIVNIAAARWQGGLNFAFSADDLMFLGHHLATIFYMTGTRILRAGHISALALMLAGELTNPFLNTYLVAGYVKDMDCCAFSEATVAAIEIPLAVTFLPIRGLVGPLMCLYISYDLLFTKQGLSLVPLRHSVPWNIMMWGVIFGSIPWIFHLWEVLQKYLPSDGNLAVPEL